MRLSLTLIVVAALAASLLSTSIAAAATEFGDPCVANRDTEKSEATIFGLSSPASPLPLAAPSAGVITSWKLNLITPESPTPPIPAIIPQTLKVFRLNTAGHTAQAVGEASGLVGSGSNTIPARISVQAGDRLGVYGHGPVTFEGTTSEAGTLYCEEETGSGNVIGAFTGTVPVGGSSAYVEGPGKIRAPAVAVLEPDADGDGYGDETQDKCPQSAATQAPCPKVTLSATGAARKGLATVSVTASLQASVTTTGTVKLGKGKSVKLSGGTQVVAPGTLAKFVLIFPKKLQSALKGLPKKRSLTLNVTVSTPNVVGAPTAKTLKLHLKGQAKAKSRSHKKRRFKRRT